MDVYIKHEEEQQKRKQDQQNQKEKQKTKKKQVREDLVEGEYDDYDERYNPYWNLPYFYNLPLKPCFPDERFVVWLTS